MQFDMKLRLWFVGARAQSIGLEIIELVSCIKSLWHCRAGGCRDRLHERGGVYMRRLPCDAGVGKEADDRLGQNTAK